MGLGTDATGRKNTRPLPFPKEAPIPEAGEFSFIEVQIEKVNTKRFFSREVKEGREYFVFGLTRPNAQQILRCVPCDPEPQHEGVAGLVVTAFPYKIAVQGLNAELTAELAEDEGEHYSDIKEFYKDIVPEYRAHHGKKFANEEECEENVKAVVAAAKAAIEDYNEKANEMDKVGGEHATLGARLIRFHDL